MVVEKMPLELFVLIWVYLIKNWLWHLALHDTFLLVIVTQNLFWILFFFFPVRLSIVNILDMRGLCYMM